MGVSVTSVTAVIVNYRTLELTRACVESLLRFYPDINVVLIDNNSKDESTCYIRDLARLHPNIRWFKTGRNVGHGPGLAFGLTKCYTPYVLTIDSDVEVLRGGWLEMMLEAFEDDPLLFAVGDCGSCDDSGVRPGDRQFVHPFCALWDKGKYSELGSFEASGQPVRGVCFAATDAGYTMKAIDGIKSRYGDPTDYVKHFWGGTRCQPGR